MFIIKQEYEKIKSERVYDLEKKKKKRRKKGEKTETFQNWMMTNSESKLEMKHSVNRKLLGAFYYGDEKSFLIF